MTYDEAIAEIESAAGVAVAEQGEDLGHDDAAHDIAISYLHDSDINAEVRFDIARCFLGWDPEEDLDLYIREGLIVCQWFVKCDLPAVSLQPHPAFDGGVPICQRCKEKLN